jgi:MFS family permease
MDADTRREVTFFPRRGAFLGLASLFAALALFSAGTVAGFVAADWNTSAARIWPAVAPFCLLVCGLLTIRLAWVGLAREPVLVIDQQGSTHRWMAIQWRPLRIPANSVRRVTVSDRVTTIEHGGGTVKLQHWMFEKGGDIPGVIADAWEVAIDRSS